jgi:hypothetical protein
MGATPEEVKEAGTQLVGELFKLLPATSGIMLALIWGLADRTTPVHDVLVAMRIGSIVLVLSIIASLLGLQFMVSAMQAGTLNAGEKGSVQFCFVAAWAGFVAGCVAVIWSLFLL